MVRGGGCKAVCDSHQHRAPQSTFLLRVKFQLPTVKFRALPHKMYSFHTAKVGRRNPTLEGLKRAEKIRAPRTPLCGCSGVHTPRATSAPRAGRERARGRSFQPRGEEQRRPTRLRDRRREGSPGAAAYPPPPPPPAAAAPPPAPCLLGGAKWRPRHKMAAGYGLERGLTETKKKKKAPRIPCPQHSRSSPSFLLVAVTHPASGTAHRRSPTAAVGLPEPPLPPQLSGALVRALPSLFQIPQTPARPPPRAQDSRRVGGECPFKVPTVAS